MSVNMRFGMNSTAQPLLYQYGYDQLNRLKNMQAFTGLDSVTNAWTPVATTDYQENISYDANGNILTYKRNGAAAASGVGMDSMRYRYYYIDVNGNKVSLDPASPPSPSTIKRYTNQLAYIDDRTSTYTDDIDDQAANNYTYDAIGNLVKDNWAGVDGITWNVYGKMTSFTKTGSGLVNYTMAAGGERISRVDGGKESWYVRDAGGNILAVYGYGDAGVNSGHLTLSNIHLYGSSRLGVIRRNQDVTQAYTAPQPGQKYFISFTRGKKLFELSNHLGNVMVSITDKKFGVPKTSNVNNTDYYIPDIVRATDYYPFGMQMPGREYSNKNTTYGYGFNGKLKMGRIYGEDNAYDYGMRIYEVRAGRFLSVDPITGEYPELTPYQYASNRPIDGVDRDGLEYLSNLKSQQLKQLGMTMFKIQHPQNIAVIRPTPQASIERHANHIEYTNFSVGKFLFKPFWAYRYLQYNTFNDAHILYTAARDGGDNATDLDYGRTSEKQRMGAFINLASTAMGVGEFTAGRFVTAEGNAIISRASNDGVKVIVARSADDLAYLKAMDAQALYMGGEGNAGSILVTKNASRSHILEEAIHHQQRMTYGDGYFYNNVAQMEIEAQNKLLKIGKREGWSNDEIKEIQSAKSIWENKLKK